MISLDNKTILVTGGSGSFGKNFIKFLLANFNCKKIIIFSRDELKQYHLEKELADSRLRFFIGDVRDLPRLQRAFVGVDIVIHAAALKQVPALEYNPLEAVKTNIIGTQNIIEAAIDQKVSKVLLISTDKAAHPANLYGSTKLCAEKLIVAGNSYASSATLFSVVRYGNVIGSRGSIVEVLLKNKNADQVQITDYTMTRFWINYHEANKLVLFALEQMEGGEIFVPKIPSMKLIDLFDTLVPQARKEIIGLRLGEKVHEVMITEQEGRHAIELDNYFVILPEFHFWSEDRYQKFHTAGKKLSNDFSYFSHTNSLWLTKEQLLEMVAEDSDLQNL
ncbi:MAG: UDP-N-acetylglucosamine 4,6-dehydratase (inverting) [Candidatus Magasanikbacteria bacterium]|nr:UDP-N-acetylglucosamine 4,6-dehydratase (inverting) [Candidatus Magasanikbacteria bacterium]